MSNSWIGISQALEMYGTAASRPDFRHKKISKAGLIYLGRKYGWIKKHYDGHHDIVNLEKFAEYLSDIRLPTYRSIAEQFKLNKVTVWNLAKDLGVIPLQRNGIYIIGDDDAKKIINACRNRKNA